MKAIDEVAKICCKGPVPLWSWWGARGPVPAMAELDFRSYPSRQFPVFGPERVPDGALGQPVFKTRSSSAQFESIHCISVDNGIVVDEYIVNIIEKFTTKDDVQFHKILLKTKDEVLKKFYWMFILRRAKCIDYENMKDANIIYNDTHPFIMEAKSFVFKNASLGKHHIARDYYHPSHAIISNELKCKLEIVDPNIDFREPKKISEPRWLSVTE